MKRNYITFTTLLLLLGFILVIGNAPTSLAQNKSISLFLGETKTVTCEHAKSFESSNQSIATVSKKGEVHAQKAGPATITVTTDTGKQTFDLQISKKGLAYPSFSMMKGEHLDMQFNTKDIADITWSSTKPSVARVSKKGVVHAKKKGSTTIKAITGKTVYECKLEVTPRAKSIIYLTFDDGPNRYSTPKILKILKKNKVHATFFELKPAKKDFDLTKQVLADGHTLGMHGYQHKYDAIYKSEKIYRNNLDKLQKLFFKKFGVWCTLSRFPGGSSNTVSHYNPGIMTRITKKIHGWGYHYFDWNVSSGDAGGAFTPAEVFKNVKSELMKGHSNVVLMHDFNKNDKTINALDRIIKYGKSQGFEFRAITASTDEIHHKVNN